MDAKRQKYTLIVIFFTLVLSLFNLFRRDFPDNLRWLDYALGGVIIAALLIAVFLLSKNRGFRR